jgi:hypothetical protein
MSTAVDSANLILKLYELRREETMRKARDFWFGFNPASADEYTAVMMGPNSGYVRMVASYWEMAAALVNHGAIDATMFEETQGEHYVVFAKVQPVLADLRAKFNSPHIMKNLEKLCLSAPGGADRVRETGERMRAMAEQVKAAAAGSQ